MKKYWNVTLILLITLILLLQSSNIIANNNDDKAKKIEENSMVNDSNGVKPEKTVSNSNAILREDEETNKNVEASLANYLSHNDNLIGEVVMTCDDFFNMAKGEKWVKKDFTLTNDIDCGGAKKNPITTLSVGVKINGGGYTVKNFVIETSSDAVGIFTFGTDSNSIENFTFSDFSVKNLNTARGTSTGGVIARLDGKISNIHVINGTVSGVENVGGVVGNMRSTSVVDNVTASNMDVVGVKRVGGILGWSQGKNATGLITENSKVQGDNFSGGSIGLVQSTSVVESVIVKETSVSIKGTSDEKACGKSSLTKTNYYGCLGGAIGGSDGGTIRGILVEKGTISGQYNIGGAIGWTSGSISDIKVDIQTSVIGNEMVGGATGGIENATVINVQSEAYVKGMVNVGGITPYIKVTGKVVKAFRTNGTTIATGYDGKFFLGGIVGANEGVLEEALNEVVVNAEGTGLFVGGVVGRLRDSGSIKNAYNIADVIAYDATKVGGLVGDMIENSSYTGGYSLGGVSGLTNVGGLFGQQETTNFTKLLAANTFVEARGSNAGAITGRDFAVNLGAYDKNVYKIDTIKVYNAGVNNNVGIVVSKETVAVSSWQENIIVDSTKWLLEDSFYPRIHNSKSAMGKKILILENLEKIVEGETTFYLNNDKTIKYAETIRDGIVRNTYEYYPDTKYGQHSSRIKYVFFFSTDGYLLKAERKKENSRESIEFYEYYPKTRYGNHSRYIKFIIYVDAKNIVYRAESKKENTRDITGFYEYYPNAVYGQHGGHIKYYFSVTPTKEIKYATERYDNRGKEFKKYYYQYGTKYGEHRGKIIKTENI